MGPLNFLKGTDHVTFTEIIAQPSIDIYGRRQNRGGQTRIRLVERQEVDYHWMIAELRTIIQDCDFITIEPGHRLGSIVES